MRNRYYSLVLCAAAIAATLFLPLLTGCGGGGGGVSGQTEVTGTVEDSAKSDSPVASATVNIGGKTATTDSSGNFDIKNAPVGTWKAIVTPPGGTAQTIAFLPKVQLLPATTATLIINIGQITGIAIVDGKPTSGVTVVNEVNGDSTQTLSDGSFLLIDEPAGSTTVFFLAGGGVASATQTLTVANGLNDLGNVTLTDISSNSPPPGAPTPTVTGTITLSDQTTPQAGTSVVLFRNGSQFETTTTDSSGNYSFYAPIDPNSTYVVTGIRSGYLNNSSPSFTLTSSKTSAVENVTLQHA